MQTEGPGPVNSYQVNQETAVIMNPNIPVHVVAQPEFIGQHDEKFAFSYTIYITNRSDQTITLRNRHWIITHGDGSVEEVIGEGVIGQTPELAPGASYSYTSGALIPTPVGSMKGSYGFVTNDGQSFRAEIPEFTLHDPDTPLH